MKELQGTEKQIVWAAKIREEIYCQVEKAISEIDFSEKQLISVARIQVAMQNDNSAYWIENFQLNGAHGLSKLFEFLNNKESGIAGRRIATKINENREED